MKILKEGNIEKINKTKYFLCRNCGCVWTANKDEYKTDTQYNQEYYTCKCPFENCGETGFAISKEVAEKEIEGKILTLKGEKIYKYPYKHPIVNIPMPSDY